MLVLKNIWIVSHGQKAIAAVNVVTDKWRGYCPIAKKYVITQVESNNGANFKGLHTMIYQVKS